MKKGFVILLAITAVNLSVQCEQVAWKWGLAEGYWNDAENWDGGRVPADGDTVICTNRLKTTIHVTNSTPKLAVLILTNTNIRELSLNVSKWDTCVYATNIVFSKLCGIKCTGSFSEGETSNRVWIVGKTMSMGGTISADGAGWTRSNGPGWAGTPVSGINYMCGAYGGNQSYISPTPTLVVPHPYGSVEEPLDPGSAGGANLAYGGGAIRIDLEEDLIMNDGEITAKGTSGGSGGGIYITCRTISGTGNIWANGRTPSKDTDKKGGSGGRIAVHYNPEAQSNVTATCSVRFEARGGIGNDFDSVSGYHDIYGYKQEWICESGTLWFPDNQFLFSEYYRSAGLPFVGVWHSPKALSELSFDSDLTLDKTCLRFTEPGFRFNVAGNFTATGEGQFAREENGLFFSNATVIVDGNLTLEGARLELNDGGTLMVGGDLIEKSVDPTHAYKRDGGALVVYAAPTNVLDTYGAVVRINGMWQMETNSVCYPYCQETNGAIVAFYVKDLVMDAGSEINANQKGWGPKRGASDGGGPGVGGGYWGASYGGKGGAYNSASLSKIKAVYGDAYHPLDAGSGGYTAAKYFGYQGGGVVFIQANRNMTLNGTISADSNQRFYCKYSTGGSGGSIYLVTRDLYGTTGTMTAKGGMGTVVTDTNNIGMGGGGRIAVWYRNASTVEALKSNASVAPGTVYGEDTTYAETGTAHWRELKPAGFSIILR
ncbi:MAG: hypothetical protein WC340_11750 [Kiritimatiellia bacterium]